MANILEKAKSILEGNLNLGVSYPNATVMNMDLNMSMLEIKFSLEVLVLIKN